MLPTIPITRKYIMPYQTADFIIIGAGIMGLAIARQLKINTPEARIIILEKEAQIGLHASGRNSGVLHSGIYYPENSLKAKVCTEGAKAMATYCDEHNLPITRIGKVIVPTHPQDDSQLDLLYSRAINNKANVHILDEHQLKELEPAVKTATGRALFAPETAVIDSKAILQHLSQQLQKQGVEIKLNSQLQQVDAQQRTIQVNDTTITFNHLFNAAGLYADVVAKKFGIADEYTMLPFKGIYYRLDPKSNIQINRLIYPVPDLNVPFLGVHLTKGVTGDVMVGPTAIPALSRENYHGLSGIKLEETINIGWNLLRQYLNNKQGFRNFAHQEAGRFYKTKFTEAAAKLVPTLKPEHLLPSTKIGIRAQLLDLNKRELVMDFLVKKTDHSTHILNAVSPAFTSAFSFANLVINN